jgi:hypothetical protein
MSFREYVAARAAPPLPGKRESTGLYPASGKHPLPRPADSSLPLSEGDGGPRAFIDAQNASLKVFLRGPLTPPGFGDYLAAREALLLPDRPARAGMARINPFPATQAKLKRLFPDRRAVANSRGPMASWPPTSPRPATQPIPSPLQAAWDGFAGFF